MVHLELQNLFNINVPGPLSPGPLLSRRVAGPLWTGPLHDTRFVQSMASTAAAWGWRGPSFEGADRLRLARGQVHCLPIQDLLEVSTNRPPGTYSSMQEGFIAPP